MWLVVNRRDSSVRADGMLKSNAKEFSAINL